MGVLEEMKNSEMIEIEVFALNDSTDDVRG
jgi:hypothetical protein